MHSEVKIYDYSYWAINKVYLLSSQNLNELIIPYLLAIRDRNSPWTFFRVPGRSEQSHHQHLGLRNRRSWAWMRPTPAPLLLPPSNLPKLTLFSFTSNWLFPHGSKTWLSVFLGFTSYTISPWKRLASTLWDTSLKKKSWRKKGPVCTV